MNKKELQWDILENVLMTTGFFPKSKQTYDVKTNTLSKPIMRTQWEDGYNAGITKVYESFFSIDEAFEKMDEEKIEKIIKLKNECGLNFYIKNEEVLFCINCNDLFYWACSDSEPLLIEEIDDFYNTCYDKDGNYIRFGVDIFVCRKRKMQPQLPIKEIIIKEGYWTEELESFEIPYDT